MLMTGAVAAAMMIILLNFSSFSMSGQSETEMYMGGQRTKLVYEALDTRIAGWGDAILPQLSGTFSIRDI